MEPITIPSVSRKQLLLSAIPAACAVPLLLWIATLLPSHGLLPQKSFVPWMLFVLIIAPQVVPNLIFTLTLKYFYRISTSPISSMIFRFRQPRFTEVWQRIPLGAYIGAEQAESMFLFTLFLVWFLVFPTFFTLGMAVAYCMACGFLILKVRSLRKYPQNWIIIHKDTEKSYALFPPDAPFVTLSEGPRKYGVIEYDPAAVPDKPITYRFEFGKVALLAFVIFGLVGYIMNRIPYSMFHREISRDVTVDLGFLFLAFVGPPVLHLLLSDLYLRQFYSVPFHSIKTGRSLADNVWDHIHTVPVALGVYLRARQVSSLLVFLIPVGLTILSPNLIAAIACVMGFVVLCYRIMFSWPVRKFPRDWMVLDVREQGFDLFPPGVPVPVSPYAVDGDNDEDDTTGDQPDGK